MIRPIVTLDLEYNFLASLSWHEEGRLKEFAYKKG